MLSFMEMRHFLALARQHGDAGLAKRITDAMHFNIRLTNMVLGKTKRGFRNGESSVAETLLFPRDGPPGLQSYVPDV